VIRFANPTKRHLAAAAVTAMVVGGAVVLGRLATSPSHGSATLVVAQPAPTYNNGVPVSQTPAPVVTPLAYPAAVYPNPYIQAGLATTGFTTYVPQSTDNAPAVTGDQAMSVAYSQGFFGNSCHNSTLALMQYNDGSRAPFLTWVVDCTPAGLFQLPGSSLNAPTSPDAGQPYKWWVVVVGAEQGSPQAGLVVFQQGSTH
jgi:hypothetical protein